MNYSAQKNDPTSEQLHYKSVPRTLSLLRNIFKVVQTFLIEAFIVYLVIMP